MPKAELHFHAEAAPRLERILARERGAPSYDWKIWAQKLMVEVPPGMPRLESIAKLPIPPQEDDREYFGKRILDALAEGANAGAIYVELRFGRDTVLRPDFIPAFRDAERAVQSEFPGFVAEPLVCLIFGPDAAQNEKRVQACVDTAQDGLRGVDFIPQPYSDEADWSPMYRVAERLATAGLGITAHAAEFSTANLKAALRVPGLTRIGHGIHALADDELTTLLFASGAVLECSLTSNVILGAVDSYAEHPIRALVDAGIPVTLNSDDPMHFSTTIDREYAIASHLGFSDIELMDLTRNAIEYSFTSGDRKAMLFERLDSHVLTA